jgi:hypothetical protein
MISCRLRFGGDDKYILGIQVAYGHVLCLVQRLNACKDPFKCEVSQASTSGVAINAISRNF